MKEYIIMWNAGFGQEFAVVEADNKEEAMEAAYEEWKETAESNANYRVVGEATEELKEEYDL